jgi:DnaJ-class molecular chaperone
MAKIDGLEIVMTKQIKKMIDKELKKRFEELKPELATRYEELLNMRNMEADQFNDGFNDARAGKLETDHPHYDLDTDNWRLGYAYGMFEPMKEKLARERQVSDALNARIAELEAEIDQLTAHDATERQDDKLPEREVCEACGGDGSILLRDNYKGQATATVDCPYCNCTGYVKECE